MASCYLHKCDHCGYSVQTLGLNEFYRDARGRRRPHGHPTPISREAERSGIAGFSAELYCPRCDRVYDLVVVEFERPAARSLDAWMGWVKPKEQYSREDAVRCPDCGNAELLLGPPEGKPPMCPRCGRGRLISEEIWIS